LEEKMMNLTAWSLLALVLTGGLATPSGSKDAASTASLERDKATARSLFEVVLSTGDWDGYRRIHALDFRAHATGSPSGSLEEDLASAKEWRGAFPNLAVRVERVVAEGALVAVQWIARGTNTGVGNGLPATGRSIEAGGITIFRMKDGLIAEEWSSIDMLQLLRQLGLLSPP
jgi:steroid delta-isomerase-like uncharacterized protein